jgi:hypothetical protein
VKLFIVVLGVLASELIGFADLPSILQKNFLGLGQLHAAPLLLAP